MSDKTQLEVEFEAGLLQQFPRFKDCLRASVYGCGRAFKAIAADLDMSQSHLSRMLSESGDLNFPADRLPDLIEATDDERPVYWLIERFLEDAAAKRERTLRQLEPLLKQLPVLIAALSEADDE